MGWPWKPDFTGEQFCIRCQRGCGQMHWLTLQLQNNFSSDTTDAALANGCVVTTMQGPFCPECYQEVVKQPDVNCKECGKPKNQIDYVWKFDGAEWDFSYPYYCVKGSSP